MPGSQHAGSCLVKVTGTALAADVEPLLAAAWVDSSLNLPDQFVLRFRDPDRVVITKAGLEIGAAVEIVVDIADGGGQVTLLKGDVTALEVDLDAEGTFTVVRGYDRSHRLRQGSRVETYLNIAYSDIVKKVAQRAGLGVGTVQATSPVHPLVAQQNVDDWTFLQQLAGEIGFRVIVEDTRLHFRPPSAAEGAPTATGDQQDPLVLRPGEDLLALRAVVSSAAQVPSVEVRSWNGHEKRSVVGTAQAATTSAQLAVSPAGLAGKLGTNPYRLTGALHRQQGAATKAAEAIAARIGDSAAELDGVILGNPALHAGVPVTLAMLGDPFDGKYTLTRARHLFDPEQGYTTAISVTGAADRSILGLTGAADTEKTAMPGVAVGVITNNDDPEKVGRVKLRLPWLAENYETDWAPTVHPGAGKDRGWLVLPEVNDQVLVGFEHGDLHHPLVLGGLYSTVDKPPASPPPVAAQNGAVVGRSFVTRTGHKLQFLEKDNTGEQGITLATGDAKLSLVLDQKTVKVSVTSDGTVVVEGARGVRITSTSGPVELSGQKVVIDGKTGVEVKSNANVAVSATAQLELKGATASLQGQATAEVKGGGMTTITGGLVKIN